MRKLLLFLPIFFFACTDDEIKHPFKFEGEVNGNHLKWDAETHSFQYFSATNLDTPDSMEYGFQLLNDDLFSMNTKRISSDQFNTYFEPGTYSADDDFSFLFILSSVYYKPKPGSGQFQITKQEIHGNKIRVWGILNCDLEVTGNYPDAKAGSVKNAQFIVEFCK